VSTDLVELFAAPLRERLERLDGDAAAIGAVRTELEVAALSFGAYADQHAKHAAPLAGPIRRSADLLTGQLRDSATALAVGTALVDQAALSVHSGQSVIRSLLDSFVSQAESLLASAASLVAVGQHGGLITASGRLAALADACVQQADAAVAAAHRVLANAARCLDALWAQA
jgi:hypothetical protein